jgi:hypothetical protein
VENSRLLEKEEEKEREMEDVEDARFLYPAKAAPARACALPDAAVAVS